MKFLERRLLREWYERPEPNRWLLPLEALFGNLVALRQSAYRRGLKSIRRLPVPVIVVGNITVGGVGKTPLVIWLVEWLREAGFRPGVISRGYGGRNAVKPQEVTEVADPLVVGDEPLLVTMRTAAPVFVHRDRFAAGEDLLARHDCNVVVADDGLQHYALHRDIEIAVVDGERRYGNGHLLPAGPLREPESRAREADLIVCRGQGLPGEYSMSIEGQSAVNLLHPDRLIPLTELRGRDLIAVAGIGNPSHFFNLLSKRDLTFDAFEFPDHHPFHPEDIPRDGRMVLMTEKDAVKCRRFATPDHWYVPVSAQLSAEFGSALLKLIEVKSNGHKIA